MRSFIQIYLNNKELSAAVIDLTVSPTFEIETITLHVTMFWDRDSKGTVKITEDRRAGPIPILLGSLYRDVSTQRKGHVGTQCEVHHLLELAEKRASGETNLIYSLILDFQPPEPGENRPKSFLWLLKLLWPVCSRPEVAESRLQLSTVIICWIRDLLWAPFQFFPHFPTSSSVPWHHLPNNLLALNTCVGVSI